MCEEGSENCDQCCCLVDTAQCESNTVLMVVAALKTLAAAAAVAAS